MASRRAGKAVARVDQVGASEADHDVGSEQHGVEAVAENIAQDAAAAAMGLAGVDSLATLAGVFQGFLQAQQVQADLIQQGFQAMLANAQTPKVGGLKEYKGFNPPEFRGEGGPLEADAWLNQVEKLLEGAKVPEDDRVGVLRIYLLEAAGSWLTTELNTHEGFIGWNEFKRVFRRRFFPESAREELRDQFLHLSQGTKSVSDYTFEFDRLSQYALEVLPTENAKIRSYIKGLNPDLKLHVRTSKPENVREAYEWALKMERDLLSQKKLRPVTSAPVPVKRNFSSMSGSSFNPVNRRPVKTFSAARPSGSTFSKGSRSMGPPVTCTYCGKLGHTASVCWMAAGKCLWCGASDHRIGDCPKKEGFQSRATAAPASSAPLSKGSVNAPSARQSMGIGRGRGRINFPPQEISFSNNKGRGRRGLFAVAEDTAEPSGDIITGTILIQSFPAVVLFDSGASNYFLSAQFAAHHKLSTTLLDKPISYGTGSGHTLVTSLVKSCPLLVGEKELVVDLLVLQLPFVDIILGMDWLSLFNA